MELIAKLIQEDINNDSTLKKLYNEQGKNQTAQQLLLI